MITKARSLQSLLLALALTASAFAQQPNANRPSEVRLRQVIEYLASDALEGRRTGTPGANNAAHYIAGEFKRLGLRPGMQVARGENQSRYLQSFPYIADVQLGKNNSLRITRQGVTDTDAGTLTSTLAVGSDWIPLGFTTNAILENSGIAFAGYGISSAALKYDDYSVSPAAGRVAVVFSGTPDGDNPHGQFVQAGEIRFKAAAARAAGARALVIITSEKSLADDRLARLSYDNTGEAGLPVILVTRRTGASLLGVSGEDLSVYEKMADARTGASGDGQQTRIARFPVGGATVSLKTDVVRRESPSFNVIGILPGREIGRAHV